MRRFLAYFIGELLFAPCSGDGGGAGGTTPPATPSIGGQRSSGAGPVPRGATGTTAVTRTRGGSYPGSVTRSADHRFTGVPAAASQAFPLPTPILALTGSLATATVTAGQSIITSIGVARTGGLTGVFAFTREGAPAGMTGEIGGKPVEHRVHRYVNAPPPRPRPSPLGLTARPCAGPAPA